jgi:transposase
MEHLDDITVAELQAALDEVEGKKPTQRLLAAIAYKNGVTQTELAEWHGVQRRTIYNWLKRLDADSLEAAVEDARRPGRPRRLSKKQQNELNSALRETPADAGYDEPEWTPDLVQRFVRERFDVDYSRPSCRRFMREVRS